MSSSPLRIDVWSDYVCPFCYLELPALQRLKTAFGTAVDIQWRAFELRPEPKPTLDPAGEYLRTTWARSVYPMAEERGVAIRLPPVQPRSRTALEAAAWADAQGAFDAMHEAIFRAFFEHGQDIGQIPVLLAIAKSVGLQTEALQQALEGHVFQEQVLADEELALNFGISGVPIMLVRNSDAPWEQSIALQGAVPYQRIHTTVEHLLAG